MGFDIYAIEPRKSLSHPEADYSYFRSNVWFWRPLWSYIIYSCPELTDEEVEAGNDNSGNKIVDTTAVMIGNRLMENINSRKVDSYKLERDKYLDSLDDVICFGCNGIGRRDDNECSSCQGSGLTKSMETYYRFDVELVKEFSYFCLNSGGFEIW